MLKPVGLLVLAVAAAYGALALAQVRTDLRPPVTTLGTSSSNGISFAWFYDPSDRSVFVCRAGSAPAGDLECKAHARLP
ncbi:MAG: hypothetical protein ABI920_13630 [Casimicrobiaceae bacterium]